MQTVANVSAAKPKAAGAIFVAPLGTTLPTTANATLNEAFLPLGYVSEDGLTNSTDMNITDIKAWGGDTVLSVQESRDNKYRFTLIEAMNIDVLKEVYGDDNVTKTSGGIDIKVNSKELAEKVYVVDMILKGNYIKRIVIPSAKVTSIGDITYVDNQAIGYEIELTAHPDTNGNTAYEYIHSTELN